MQFKLVLLNYFFLLLIHSISISILTFNDFIFDDRLTQKFNDVKNNDVK